MDEELLGFDIRLCLKDYPPAVWDKSRRDRFLLRPDIIWPLSVDRLVWPSFFFDYTFYGERTTLSLFPGKGIPLSPMNYRHKVLHIWPDLEKMKLFFLQESKRTRKSGIVIGIVVYSQTPLNEFEFTCWSGALDPRLSTKLIPDDWLFLGYDVADGGTLSGLSNCGYKIEEREELEKTWRDRLNEVGLIKDFNDALEFQELSNKRVQPHAPFFVYSLHQDPVPLHHKNYKKQPT